MTDHFDKDPRPLEKSTNGFILCPTCERVVEVTHVCGLKLGGFTECAACSAKPGAPTLCPSCVANRDEIHRLKALIGAAERVQHYNEDDHLMSTQCPWCSMSTWPHPMHPTTCPAFNPDGSVK